MAEAKSNRGGLPAVIIGAILVVAVVGAPFYLPATRSDDAKLRDAVAPQLEKAASAIAEVNGNLASIGELRKQLIDADVQLTADSAAAAAERAGKDLDEVDKQLAETARLLSAVQNKYKTLLSDPIPAAGRAAGAARETFGKLNTLLAANEASLKEADARVREMLGFTFGSQSGRSDMAVNRMAALVAYQQALTAANRADMLRRQAASDRLLAASLLNITSEARRSAASVKTRVPDDLIRTLKERTEELPKAIAAGDKVRTALEQIVGQQDAKAKELRGTAAGAREQLAQMDAELRQKPGGSSAFAGMRERYARLSTEARQAEAAAEALENGWLQGARLNEDVGEDLLSAVYEGGRPVPGLNTLRLRLDGAQRDLDALKRALDESNKQLEDAEAQSTQMTAQFGEMTKLAEECMESVDGLLKRATERSKEARTSEDAALSAFESALRSAQAATTAAVNRGREAQSELGKSPPDKVNERLKEIADDRDSEGATRFLTAQIGCAIGEVMFHRISDLNSADLLADLRAKELGEAAEPAGAEAVAAARKRGREAVDRAIKELTDAAKRVETAAYTVDQKRISGKDYVWQFQSAQAAAHLLLGQLSEKDDDRLTERDKAYDLLTKAAKGREGSPLLSPAVDMVLYLQKSAGAK